MNSTLIRLLILKDYFLDMDQGQRCQDVVLIVGLIFNSFVSHQ